MKLYNVLNRHAKSYPWNINWRQDGDLKKARSNERHHIKSSLNTLQDAVKYGGCLTLGRYGWSLKVMEHPSSYSDTTHPSSYSETTTTSSTLSGYYDSNQDSYIIEACRIVGIPIKDNRNIVSKGGG